MVVMSNDTTTLEATVDTYLATWNETDADKRGALIEQALGADLWYRDPMLEADGREAYDGMIAAVQAQFPGLVMTRTSPVDTHRDVVRFNWALGAPGEAPVFAGLDVAKTDADGKLHRIIGFAGETIAAAYALPANDCGERRSDVAGLAGGPPAQPVGPGDRRRRVDPSPQLRGDRQVEALPELVLALAEHLDVPLRERNSMLLAAGYAPRYPQTPLDGPAMANVRTALAGLLRAHDPYPAVVVDRVWDVVLSNTGAQALLEGVGAHVLAPGLNSYRVTLHPDGMAPRIVNFAEWAHHMLGTLDRQVAATRDPRLRALLDEVSTYPNVAALGSSWRTRSETPTVVVPLRAAGRRPRAVLVLDQHVDRHARRHHARGAARRAVPPRRRGDRCPGRRTHGLSNVSPDGHHPGRHRRRGGRDRRRRRGAVATGDRGGRPRPSGRCLEVQRPVVEPADPVAPRPALGLTGR